MFIILFGGYLHFIYRWGKYVASRAATSSLPESLDYDSGKRMLSRVKLILWCFVFPFNFDPEMLFTFFSELLLYCIYRSSATDVIM